MPYFLPLYKISELINKFDDNDTKPQYEEQKISELLDENYHPYNYGTDIEPDQEKRRLFSFISFDFEFDLLDIYLAENYEIVDYFVIFETNTTAQGKPKPYYFTRMLLETNRYENFKNKLIPIPYEVEKKEDDKTTIDKINNIIVEKGLRAVKARHGDLFVYGTVGEIPKPHVLARLKKCGGWEHLYSGYNGADNRKVETPISFSSWAYGYSFSLVENDEVATILKPKLAIFDARRSSDSNDLYQAYSDFNLLSNDDFEKTDPILWSAGWDMKNILPNIDHIYLKYTMMKNITEYQYAVKDNIFKNINNHENIFYKDKKYVERIKHPKIPSLEYGYPYKFDYTHWKEEASKFDNKKFKYEIENLINEIPIIVGKNSICYNYMFDRKFGISDSLWWEAVPQQEWEQINFNEMDFNSSECRFCKLAPWVCPGHLHDLKILSMEETVIDIAENRKSISRFGDGEYNLAIYGGGNGYQKNDEKLAEKLRTILFSNEEDFLVGIPDDFSSRVTVKKTNNFWGRYVNRVNDVIVDVHNINKVYGSSMLSRFYLITEDKSWVPQYVEKLKKIWENKDIVIIEGELTRFGVRNDLLKNVKSVKRILCPSVNSYDHYDEIYAEAIKQDKNVTFLISLGQTATLLAYDLYKQGYQAIDIGHTDIEYEWYIRKAKERIRIDYKYVIENKEGKTNIEEVKDKDYVDSIITRIGNTENNDGNNDGKE